MSATGAMVRSEARLLARNPGVVLWTVLLPVAACIILSSLSGTTKPMASFGGASVLQVYQPILVMFVMVLLSVQALPDVLTRYREMGILKRLRTTPASPTLLLVAQFVLISSVSIACATVMVLVPGVVAGMWPQQPVGFVLSYLLAMWAFMGIGMVISGVFRNAKVAAGFGTVVFFVLVFFAGLWIPRPTMPDWMRTISDLTPSGAASDALTRTAAGSWPDVGDLVTLAVWAVLGTVTASRVFKWE